MIIFFKGRLSSNHPDDLRKSYGRVENDLKVKGFPDFVALTVGESSSVARYHLVPV